MRVRQRRRALLGLTLDSDSPLPAPVPSAAAHPSLPGPAQPGASFEPRPQGPLSGPGFGERDERRCRWRQGWGDRVLLSLAPAFLPHKRQVERPCL